MQLPRSLPALASLLIAGVALCIFVGVTLPRLRSARETGQEKDSSLTSRSLGIPAAVAAGQRSSGPAGEAERLAWLERRLRAALDREDKTDEIRALLMLMPDMQPGDYRQMLELVRRLRPVEDTTVSELLMEGWAACDPAAAMIYAKGEPSLVFFGLKAWCARDSDGAFEWLIAHPELRPDESSLQIAAESVVKKSPERLRELLGCMQEKEGVDLLRYLRELKHPEATKEMFLWALELKDEEARYYAMEELESRWREVGYRTSLDLLLQRPEAIVPAALFQPFREWTRVDSSAVADALGQLPAGQVRSAALSGALSEMLDSKSWDAGISLLERYSGDVDDHALKSWTESEPVRAWMSSPAAPPELQARARELAIESTGSEEE